MGPVNAPLHAKFSQVDMSIQQQPISEVGPYYAYKGYLDTLLDTEDEAELNSQELNSQLFIKDRQIGTTTFGNTGLLDRTSTTKNSKSFDIVGGLKLDLCQQDRLLLNGLPINLKLWQTNDSFRLMAKDNSQKYKLHIEDALLRVAIAKINPGILLGHTEALKKSEAMYPFKRSVVKTYAMAAGLYSFTKDDLFQGDKN